MSDFVPLPWQSEHDLPPDAVELPAAPLGLHPSQREVFDNLKRFNVVAAGRRFGKTYLACKLACWFLRHTHAPDGTSLHNSDVWYVSPTIDLALETAVPMILEELGEEVKQHHKVQNWIQHENGRKLYLKSSTRADTLRGRRCHFVCLDELSVMGPGVWETVILPSLIQGGHAFLIGTPIGRGRLFDVFQDAQSKPDLWGTWKFLTIDNPTISQSEIDAAATSMSATQFKQEFEADWTVGGGNVFNPKQLKQGNHPRGVCNIAAVFGSVTPFAKDAHATTGKRAAIVVCRMHPTGWHVVTAKTGWFGVSEMVRKLAEATAKYAPRFLAVSAKDEKASKNLFRQYQRHHDVRLVPRFWTIDDPDDIDRQQWALQSRLKAGQITVDKGRGGQQLRAQLQDFPLEYSSLELVQALSYFDQLPQPNFGPQHHDRFQALDGVAGY